jgi:hypothetical protein
MQNRKDVSNVSGKFRFVKYERLLKNDGTPYSLVEKPLSKRVVTYSGEFIENLIVLGTNTGLSLISKRLIGDKTDDIEITSASIGTSDTAVTDSDTDLNTPVVTDIPRATQDYTLGESVFQFFIPSDDFPNGDYKEIGLFCGENMFTHAIITPTFTKATNEDVGIDYVITFTN